MNPLGYTIQMPEIETTHVGSQIAVSLERLTKGPLDNSGIVMV